VTTSDGTRATLVQVDGLPPVLDVPTAAALLGIGKTAAYKLVREGQFPVPVLHLGRSVRIPTAPLLKLVRIAG
jgi:excisionase family DNA binding protein